jgi:hypothetical protein
MPLLLLHARAATASWVVVRNVLVLPKDSTPRGQAARPACNWRARGGETYVNGKLIPPSDSSARGTTFWATVRYCDGQTGRARHMYASTQQSTNSGGHAALAVRVGCRRARWRRAHVRIYHGVYIATSTSHAPKATAFHRCGLGVAAAMRVTERVSDHFSSVHVDPYAHGCA